jgi:hypothetical protein
LGRRSGWSKGWGKVGMILLLEAFFVCPYIILELSFLTLPK